MKLLYPILGEVRSMIELGNKRTKNLVFKHFFEEMGIRHTSIDWNGKDGAMPLDLTKPIHLPPADVVTNFGTSEHVHDQEAVFENIHNLSKKWIVHSVPYVGNWKDHGIRADGRPCFKYDEDFFDNLAQRYQYHIDTMFLQGGPGKVLINVRFRK